MVNKITLPAGSKNIP